MKPAHTACTSKPKPRVMPSRLCTMVATEGKVRSGVEVATSTPSMSSMLTPAFSSAAVAALTARSEVVSPSAAKCRRSIPERVRIHSSEVSRNSSNHVFGTIRSGR